MKLFCGSVFGIKNWLNRAQNDFLSKYTHRYWSQKKPGWKILFYHREIFFRRKSFSKKKYFFENRKIEKFSLKSQYKSFQKSRKNLEKKSRFFRLFSKFYIDFPMIFFDFLLVQKIRMSKSLKKSFSMIEKYFWSRFFLAIWKFRLVHENHVYISRFASIRVRYA